MLESESVVRRSALFSYKSTSSSGCNMNNRLIVMHTFEYIIVSMITAHTQTCTPDAPHNLINNKQIEKCAVV